MPENNYTFLFKALLVSTTILIYSISFDSKILNNKVTKFISGISLEMYLSHMVVFRIVEKLKLTHIVSNNIVSYIITYVLVVAGTIVFAELFRICTNKITTRRLKHENINGK